MTFEFEWTDDNEARIYWGDEEIGVTDTDSNGKTTRDGVPVGAIGIASDWVASLSTPDEQQLQEAIERMAAILANQFEER